MQSLQGEDVLHIGSVDVIFFPAQLIEISHRGILSARLNDSSVP